MAFRKGFFDKNMGGVPPSKTIGDTMEKQFRLKKDLFGCKAGTIGVYSEYLDSYKFAGDRIYSFSRKEVFRNPDWFEEVDVCKFKVERQLFVINPDTSAFTVVFPKRFVSTESVIEALEYWFIERTKY